MKKILLIILAIVILLAGCSHESNGVSVDENGESKQENQQEAEVTTENNIVWRVQPTLEYESIARCGMCDNTFLDGEDQLVAIDPQTGRPNKHHCELMTTSGVMFAPFVYDIQRGLFGHPGSGYMYGRGGGGWIMEYMIGMHPLGAIDESILSGSDWAPIYMLNRIEGFIAVESVDSSKREEFEDDEDREFRLTPDAHSGKYALMYNREFVTDFIFDGTIKLNDDVYAVRTEDNWGAMDRNGDPILPFEFEHFLRIDDYAAFAKYSGAYGILDLS